MAENDTTPSNPVAGASNGNGNGSDHNAAPKAGLLIALNILGVVVLTLLAAFVVQWPDVDDNNSEEVARAADRGYSAEAWQNEAEIRAELADKAADHLLKTTLVFYGAGMLLLILLLINSWYLFIYTQRMRKANRRLATLEKTAAAGASSSH